MTYDEYVAYHLRGDAGIEERTIAAIVREKGLSEWDAFRLVYFYAMTYHIPSALSMLFDGERDIKRLKFRTDRRWVGYCGRFDRLAAELTPDKLAALKRVTDTRGAYAVVSSWWFFSRYASFLFLECWMNVARPDWTDNITFGFEPDELYTKGAVAITGSRDRTVLNRFLDRARASTHDNAFAIETSLCAVGKFEKGTRYDGYYTERMLSDAAGTKWNNLIYGCAK